MIIISLLLVLWVRTYSRSASPAPNARSSCTCDVAVKKICRLSVSLWARTTGVCTGAIASFRSRYSSPPICWFSLRSSCAHNMRGTLITIGKLILYTRLCVKSYACWRRPCATGRALWKSSNTPSRSFSRCRASSRHWPNQCSALWNWAVL